MWKQGWGGAEAVERTVSSPKLMKTLVLNVTAPAAGLSGE